MKIRFYSLLVSLLCLPLFSIAQLSVETLISGNSFWVNGGMKSSYSGRSRITVPVELPPNTVGVIYEVSTERDEQSEGHTVDLASQVLGALSSTYTGVDVVQVAQLMKGSSQEVIVDTHILPTIQDANNFVAKADGYWNVLLGASRTNFMGGSVGVRTNPLPTPTLVYLGIRNPQTMSGVKVTVEVVALVSQ